MYIVAIAWLYVTFMMAITESSFVAGVMTFIFYGLAPLALFLWLVGTPARRRRRARREQAASVRQEDVNQPDAANTQPDEGDLLQGGGDGRALVQTGNEIGDGDVHHAGRGQAEQHRHPPLK